MGWFSSSKKEETTAPNREDRQKCWETRDAYYACLDSVSVVKAGEEGSACAAQKKSYEDNCAKSWVRTFIVALKTFVDALHDAD
jgi:cytochrome c oxidase assembly factor 6